MGAEVKQGQGWQERERRRQVRSKGGRVRVREGDTDQGRERMSKGGRKAGSQLGIELGREEVREGAQIQTHSSKAL